jgi:hypothetical protein
VISRVDRRGVDKSMADNMNSAITGKFSIFSDVTHFDPEGQKEERSFVCTVSRVLSGHCSARQHLGRFRIVEDLMCV